MNLGDASQSHPAAPSNQPGGGAPIVEYRGSDAPGRLMNVIMRKDKDDKIIGGSGYSEDTTTVEIFSVQGMGATAQAMIDTRGSVMSIVMTRYGRNYPRGEPIQVIIRSTSGGIGADAFAFIPPMGWSGTVADNRSVPTNLKVCVADSCGAILACLGLVDLVRAVWDLDYALNLRPLGEDGVSMRRVIAFFHANGLDTIYTEFARHDSLLGAIKHAGHYVVSLHLNYENAEDSQGHCVGLVVKEHPDGNFTCKILDFDRGLNAGYVEKEMNDRDLISHCSVLAALDANIRTRDMHPVEMVQVFLRRPEHEVLMRKGAGHVHARMSYKRTGERDTRMHGSSEQVNVGSWKFYELCACATTCDGDFTKLKLNLEKLQESHSKIEELCVCAAICDGDFPTLKLNLEKLEEARRRGQDSISTLSSIETQAASQDCTRRHERDRYNEGDRSRGWQCDTDSARDRDRDRGSDNKLFNHVNELNKQILNKSDTRELFRGRDGPDRQKDRGKCSGEDRGSDSRDRNDRNNDKDRNKDSQRSGDRPRDNDRAHSSDRDRQYTLTRRPSKPFNIGLNKQLMRISDTRELCDFVSTHVSEFNHVNVATAFRQVLQKPTGMHPQSLTQALQTLEQSALQNMPDFDARGIANTLHIMAKQRYKTKGPLLLALEGRAEAVAGELSAQEVSNVLWAYATMGRMPGERMMGLLEGRSEAIAGQFSSQHVANLLWAYATMGRKPGERMMGLLEGRSEAIAGQFSSQHVANVLWVYAKMARKPGERMMGLLEGRAEAVAGESSSQEVSNVL
jgi:hypothetical protein